MSEKQNKNQGPKVEERQLTKFEEYLYANLLFWGFLVIVAVISFFTCGAVWDDVTEGVMEFLFVIMGGGFTLVSVLDYTYEKYLVNPVAEGKK
jgi:uncharacterized membrane-anchored protein